MHIHPTFQQRIAARSECARPTVLPRRAAMRICTIASNSGTFRGSIFKVFHILTRIASRTHHTPPTLTRYYLIHYPLAVADVCVTKQRLETALLSDSVVLECARQERKEGQLPSCIDIFAVYLGAPMRSPVEYLLKPALAHHSRRIEALAALSTGLPDGTNAIVIDYRTNCTKRDYDDTHTTFDALTGDVSRGDCSTSG